MPELLAACDWSISPGKRWFAVARRHGGFWAIDTPAPVGPLDDFFARLQRMAPGGGILTGFDFPIGLPRHYAALAGIESFAAVLPQLGEGRWQDFYRVAENADEISLLRPFYPRAPGDRKKQHLVDRLGLNSPNDLLRVCDRATATRRKACEIFWTLGANQVGRAAIAGWRDLLAPAMREDIIRLWPFESGLDSDRIVAAEIYPAETYAHLGLDKGFGKTSAEGRRSQSPKIAAWCDRQGIELRFPIDDCAGDDPFDAAIGVLGMIEAVTHPDRFPLPPDPAIQRLEGWILGMSGEALL